MTEPRLEEMFGGFVRLALGHIGREYPSKLDHVLNDAGDLKSPRELHPVFYGSFDWHSCVHGHWLLARAIRMCPHEAWVAQVRGVLDERLTAEGIAGELAYLVGPGRGSFERPYGWAWLLKLAAELRAGATVRGDRGAGLDDETIAAFSRWDRALAPLASAFEARFLAYLPKATYPVRTGTHGNSAFALALALDYARTLQRPELARMIEVKAYGWFMNDAACPAWEPDGTDFLSPCLMEAECMRRVLGRGEFLPWFERFLPGFAAGRREPATLFTPALVSDRSDGHIAHLDGFNLSRAWCWRSIARVLLDADGTGERGRLAMEAHTLHLAAALPHIAGDYAGEHWLATFAMLALTE